MACTRLNWASLAMGPSTVASERGSPTMIALAVSAASNSTSANLSFGTIIRVGALHDCPTLRNADITPSGTALAKSASGSRMFGDFPPSSCVTRFTVWAAACATSAPARFEPVIEIISISGCAAIAAPTSDPLPFTRLKTPGGRPASWTSCANRRALRGDSSLGLRTTVHPAAIAGATFAVI
ncbi:hypothetical protein D3C76_1121480 [compost metagenome]